MSFVHNLPAKLRRRRTTPQEVMLAIFLLLVASSSLRDRLAGASSSWWMRFGFLPIYSYVTCILLPTILLINAYILINDNLPLTPSTLLRNTRLTWRHMASAMFYQNLGRQGIRLILWSLGAASAALPAWLWWLDAVAKPARLLTHLLLLHQEMIWAVCLVFLALAIVGAGAAGEQLLLSAVPSGIWFDLLPWMNAAEAIVRGEKATGMLMACCIAGVRAVYHGAIAGLLPAVLRHLLACAGTMAVISTYTHFTFTNLIKHRPNAGLAPAEEAGNQGVVPEVVVQSPAVEAQTGMHHRGFTV